MLRLNKNMMYFFDECSDKGYVVNIESCDKYVLDEIANLVFSKIDEGIALEELIDYILKCCRTSNSETIKKDISEFVEQLKKDKFIKENELWIIDY